VLIVVAVFVGDFIVLVVVLAAARETARAKLKLREK